MAPRPKVPIPAEYANVAEKLSSETPNISGEFSDALDNFAKSLSDNLDSRSVDLMGGSGVPLFQDRTNLNTVKEAGVFAKTEGTKTPDVKSPADFEVSMDELLQKHKEPKAVEGSGVMKVNPNVEGGVNETYDKTSGVLMEPSGYTPDATEPSTFSAPYGRHQKTNEVLDTNNLINENKMNLELANQDKPYIYANKQNGTGDNRRFRSVENIPTVAAGAVGAGVLLSSQNADAKEQPLEQQLQLDTGSTYESPPKVDLLKKADENIRTGRNLPSGSVTENGNTSTVMDELQNLKDSLVNRAKGNLTAFAKDVGSAYTSYHAEKDALKIRANEMVNRMEANGQVLSDDDKALISAELGLKAGSPLVSAESDVEGMIADVSKFNHEVIQPIKGAIRSGYHSIVDGRREWEQQHIPSIAVLNDTLAYPLLGSTGWNIKPDSLGSTDSDATKEDAMNMLDPEVRKLFDDKAALLDTDAGKAMFVLANKFADLPLWLATGTSKIGLMMGGALNEIMSDDKDADLTRGAVLGLGAGKVMETILAPVAKGGLSLLSKYNKVESGIVKNFISGAESATYDTIPENVSKLWNALVNKNTVEPMLLMTGKTATMMADNALMKVRPDVSEAMNTKVIAPQALVLSIEPATGKPKLYGVKDGLYGELTDFVNPEGRPVLINQIAKQEWMDNAELRKVWNDLIDPKRKTPNTRAAGIDEWSPDNIPPENPALVFAWKQMQDGTGGATEVYRAGSRDFAKDFLKSRVPVRVEYDGPNGEPTTGIGFWGAGGDVVFAPDASENIPGAIPKDLTFKQTRMNPNVPATKPLPPENMAWEINHLSDEDIYKLVDDMKARNELQRGATEEAARGTLADGVTLPDKRPPAPFDNVNMNAIGPGLAAVGGALANHNAATAAAAAIISFLPPAKQAIGKALLKMNNGAGKLGLIGDTVYGELFKVDASIQAFSLRHYKRLTDDLGKQLIDSFKDAATTPQQRLQFNDQLRYFIENHQVNNPAPLPQQLQLPIQQKVQKYVAERNLDYAEIENLGGTVPDTVPGGNAELERMFALDYFTDEADKYAKSYRKKIDKFLGIDVTGNQWLDRMRDRQHIPDSLINLLGDKSASKATKKLGHYDQVMGRMSTEKEMSNDYMQRKLQLNQLAFMKVLADNPQASSPAANQALGHVRQVDSQSAGKLKGKWVSDETYNAVFTYPQDQKMLQNDLLGVVNMIKFSKTVLNPTTWVKNIMGNVWGVMNSNIVSSWNMAYRMPRGINIMNKDLAKFNVDVMANDPAVHRVHETLKYGLLGAEFESSRTDMLNVLDNLAEPIAHTSNRSWGEKIANGYFLAKDNTLGAMAHVYSKVDMATKYSLYVNGLERWGIDLGTNKIKPGAQGRRMAADLLGATMTNNFQIDDATLTDFIKREIVRRIHLSLPMVDRIGPVATGFSKLSPITSPWLRTSSELMRATLQMPYRMYNEKGYAVNALKTASFLGTILGVNKALRLREGISDEMVDDAKRIAPANIKNYMPGATATQFYAGQGKDRGIVNVDLANGLVEPLQWFKGGEVNNGTDVAKHLTAYGVDLIMGGGLLSQESKDAQAAMGLIDTPQNYGVPFWKQGDAVRYATQRAMDNGPQIFNNMSQLYTNNNMPNRKGVNGKDTLEQPLPMQVLKTLGIPVATMGSKNQKEYKIAELEKRKIDMIKKGAFSGLQREGSSTGAMQEPYNKKEVKAKYDAEVKRLTAEIVALRHSKSVKKDDSAPKIDLLNTNNMLTPHL